MESCSNNRETLRFPTVEPLLNDVRFIRTLSFDTSHDLIVNCPPSPHRKVFQRQSGRTFIFPPSSQNHDLWPRIGFIDFFDRDPAITNSFHSPFTRLSPSPFEHAGNEISRILKRTWYSPLHSRAISTCFVPCVHFLSLSLFLPLFLSFFLFAQKGKSYIRSTMYFTIPRKMIIFRFCLPQFNISFEQRFIHIYIYIESFLFVIFILHIIFLLFFKKSSSGEEVHVSTKLERLYARSS